MVGPDIFPDHGTNFSFLLGFFFFETKYLKRRIIFCLTFGKKNIAQEMCRRRTSAGLKMRMFKNV